MLIVVYLNTDQFGIAVIVVGESYEEEGRGRRGTYEARFRNEFNEFFSDGVFPAPGPAIDVDEWSRHGCSRWIGCPFCCDLQSLKCYELHVEFLVGGYSMLCISSRHSSC